MVVLRDSNHASIKLSSTIALVASRRTSSENWRPPNILTESAVKRRSMCTVSPTMALPHKRPRTSWGRPHSNPAALVCSSPFFKEETASSTSACDRQDYLTGAASSCGTVPSPCEATSFVKTEPLQHLAVKLEQESYEDGPLHPLVPTFFPIEQLLTTSNCNPADVFDQRSQCVHTLPPLSSWSWPVSPLSSSASDEFSSDQPTFSSVTDELSGDDMLNWDQDFHEESCELLSEQFYKLERDMSSILGADAEPRQVKNYNLKLQKEVTMVATLVQLDVRCGREDMAEEGPRVCEIEEMMPDCSQVSEVISCFYSVDLDTAATSVAESGVEEEYRIDLVDFEPDELHGGVQSVADGAGIDGDQHDKLFTGPNSFVRRSKVTLSLDYDVVVSAWCDRGSLFTDGRRRPQAPSPDDYTLDLTEWEPKNEVSFGQYYMQENMKGFPESISRMINVTPTPDDGTACVADIDGDIISSSSSSRTARHARVLRYREKRRSRLFSKKIRYEVRKLNAERRPRMKGRFIKRSAA